MKKYRFVFSVTILVDKGFTTLKSVGIGNWLVPSSYVIAKVLENYRKHYTKDSSIVQSYCKYLEVVE